MEKRQLTINGVSFTAYCLNTVIAGTGAAGYNAADSLYDLGVTDIALITEGVNCGTSRNTGSDKQTYYKLTLAGGAPDSVMDMARTLYDGGSMHGDIALAEAALSAGNFLKLVRYGVPFPHNRYGEYIGYKTDHDPRMRATSTGPYTSKLMTERLAASVAEKNIRVFDGYLIVDILTDAGRSECIGLIALDMNGLDNDDYGLTVFLCTNVIYAVGGPGDIYQSSVYPASQTGGTGIAMIAGAKGINLTESQYGLASTKFRWNLSGTYQQVIPRYVSVNRDLSDEREFLDAYFDSPEKLLTAIFLKGYEWPFDPRKLNNQGSSNIDILVHREISVNKRRVFLDFTKNPACSLNESGEFDFSLLEGAAYDYLKNSGALYGTPIARLEKMNPLAIELYGSNGIDITKEYLETAVCAQHNNGGLMGNVWWESNLAHFFPAGEVNGTFGVYRPGGSALNSTQTGSLRAAQYIARHYSNPPDTGRLSEAEKNVSDIYEYIKQISYGTANAFGIKELNDLKDEIKQNMSVNGAFLRSAASARDGIDFCLNRVDMMENRLRINSRRCLPEVFRIKNIILTQLAYLGSIARYISDGGKSRGSYLISKNGETENVVMDTEHARLALVTELNADGSVRCFWEDVRPIPEEDNWFENVWRDYRDGKVIT